MFVALKVEDIAAARLRPSSAQRCAKKKTGVPVRFEVTEQTRQAVDDYIRTADRKARRFSVRGAAPAGAGACRPGNMQRLVGDWIPRHRSSIPACFGTHSLRRTKATLIYRRTGNLSARSSYYWAIPRSKARCAYLGIEVDDALAIAEQVDV